jgi:hypothetical protein
MGSIPMGVKTVPGSTLREPAAIERFSFLISGRFGT